MKGNVSWVYVAIVILQFILLHYRHQNLIECAKQRDPLNEIELNSHIASAIIHVLLFHQLLVFKYPVDYC